MAGEEQIRMQGDETTMGPEATASIPVGIPEEKVAELVDKGYLHSVALPSGTRTQSRGEVSPQLASRKQGLPWPDNILKRLVARQGRSEV